MSATQELAEAPTYWLAVDDDGQVVYGLHTDDANGGEVSRSLVNSYINDRWLNGYKLHLYGVFARPAVITPCITVGVDVACNRFEFPIAGWACGDQQPAPVAPAADAQASFDLVFLSAECQRAGTDHGWRGIAEFVWKAARANHRAAAP